MGEKKRSGKRNEDVRVTKRRGKAKKEQSEGKRGEWTQGGIAEDRVFRKKGKFLYAEDQEGKMGVRKEICFTGRTNGKKRDRTFSC